jgi:hypothetical protein
LTKTLKPTIRIKREERKYKFIGYRTTPLLGLFGMIEYTRAYYHSRQEGGGGYFPLDEKLGIDKHHTPGCVSIFYPHSQGGRRIKRAWSGCANRRSGRSLTRSGMWRRRLPSRR